MRAIRKSAIHRECRFESFMTARGPRIDKQGCCSGNPLQTAHAESRSWPERWLSFRPTVSVHFGPPAESPTHHLPLYTLCRLKRTDRPRCSPKHYRCVWIPAVLVPVVSCYTAPNSTNSNWLPRVFLRSTRMRRYSSASHVTC